MIVDFLAVLDHSQAEFGDVHDQVLAARVVREPAPVLEGRQELLALGGIGAVGARQRLAQSGIFRVLRGEGIELPRDLVRGNRHVDHPRDQRRVERIGRDVIPSALPGRDVADGKVFGDESEAFVRLLLERGGVTRIDRPAELLRRVIRGFQAVATGLFDVGEQCARGRAIPVLRLGLLRDRGCGEDRDHPQHRDGGNPVKAGSGAGARRHGCCTFRRAPCQSVLRRYLRRFPEVPGRDAADGALAAERRFAGIGILRPAVADPGQHFGRSVVNLRQMEAIVALG